MPCKISLDVGSNSRRLAGADDCPCSGCFSARLGKTSVGFRSAPAKSNELNSFRGNEKRTFIYDNAPLRAGRTRRECLRDGSGLGCVGAFGRVRGSFRCLTLQPLPDTNAVDCARDLHGVAIGAGQACVPEFLVGEDKAGYVQLGALVALSGVVTNGMLQIR
jgi:hypothetical protein